MKTFIRIFCLLIICAFFLQTEVFAKRVTAIEDSSNFENVKEVYIPPIKVPTVVELPFSQGEVLKEDFLVIERTSERALPWYALEERSSVAASAKVYSAATNASSMIDGNESTFGSFPLPKEREGTAEVEIQYASPIEATSLFVGLAPYVAAPVAVDVFSRTGSEPETIVVSGGVLRNQMVYFPATRANTWRVVMRYTQPLLVTELRFPETTSRTVIKGLRFLAQPGQSYSIFYNPEGYAHTPNLEEIESGDLRGDEGVLRLSPVPGERNRGYIPVDQDNDTVPDKSDNCALVANQDQVDVDGNGQGDACDDFDRDGKVNAEDNCVNLPNTSQADRDGDAIGDACDPDESRFTERHAWVSWVGIGIAALVLLGLFGIVARGNMQDKM